MELLLLLDNRIVTIKLLIYLLTRIFFFTVILISMWFNKYLLRCRCVLYNMVSKLVTYFVCCVICSMCVSILVTFLLLYTTPQWSSNHILITNSKLDLKYILIWTSSTADPIINLGVGISSFVNKKCPISNCYVSSNRRLFKDVTDFDVIVFHGPELTHNPSQLPQSRFTRQKYVFASMESSEYYPVCNKMYNNYFNWTWTYKLKSDIYYGYIAIRDEKGNVIGPREEMHWKKFESMKPINDTMKAKLSTKKYAVAWFVSNCGAPSKRDQVARQLQIELDKYNMTVDIFGTCGTKWCPKGAMAECLRHLESDYYFYLSFENSFSEDYVTEKLLHALKHYAVPVVYGGANYTRFIADGMYLVARRRSIKKLAREMVNIIHDKEKYYSYFKWHNHYSYHDVLESPNTDSYCRLCAMINNKEYFNRNSVYNDFINWWSPHNKCSN